MWECLLGLKEKNFSKEDPAYSPASKEDLEDSMDAADCEMGGHAEQMTTSTRTEQRTNEDGTVETITTTEERRIVNGKEVVNTKQTITQNGEVITTDAAPRKSKKLGIMPTNTFGNFFQWKQKKGTQSTPAAVAPSTSPPVSLSEFRQSALSAHNEYRKLHGAAPLQTSGELEALAQEWADHMAATGKFAHRENSGVGENIYSGFNSSETIQGSEPVKAWYDEIKDYNFKKQGFASNTGHFTQVVWKGSKEVGVGMAVAPGGQVYVVANYKPAGNVMKQFDKNVGAVKK